ncbi:MAG: glycoside hydrolase family 3 protein [Actinomycetales bacterium]|nr:glycoside hydrolase family 3 protein [Actinomycetales bacterium]
MTAALVLVAAVTASGVACSTSDRADSADDADSTAASPAATSAPAEPAGPVAPCDSPFADMTQRERIAQLFTVGVSSIADARRAVEEFNIGGVFIGSGVVGEVVSGYALAQLQRDAPLPLLVAIDEEGGRVSRVAPYAGPIPSARVMAATMSPEEVRAIARGRGEFLARMGVTVDFAPSLDVSAQPDQSVIGDRSFSADPAQVITYARAFATGLLDAGITPVFKHFPGHGRSSGDSHVDSVTVPPLDQLVPHDLRPFAELASIPGTGMMLGHQEVPGLTGADRPASLSPATYRLLREGHGYDAPAFKGPIFTDDLSGMRAISGEYSLPRAVTEALIAGADSPLWITTDGIGEAVTAVEGAVANGVLSTEDLDRSLERMADIRRLPECATGPITGRLAGAGSLTGPTVSPSPPPPPPLAPLPR